MDNLKIFASSSDQLNKMLEIIKQFSKDIRLEFGLDKCKTMHIHRGKLTIPVNHEEPPEIEYMQEFQQYKYLRIELACKTDNTSAKIKLNKEVCERVGKIANTNMKGRYIIKAVNTYTIPILTYSFGIMKWSISDIQDIERRMLSIMTKYGHHHPKACTERWTLPRNEGGKGVQNFHNKQIQKLREYFYNRDSPLHHAVIDADKNYTPLNLHDRNIK
jgi:hypothetical protein